MEPKPNNKTLPTRLPPMDEQQKHNIQGDIRTLLGKDCEEKMMRFLREIGCLRKYRDDRRLTRSAN